MKFPTYSPEHDRVVLGNLHLDMADAQWLAEVTRDEVQGLVDCPSLPSDYALLRRGTAIAEALTAFKAARLARG
jgi:hypothetical protein